MRPERNVKPRIHMLKEPPKRHAAIACEAPAKPTLPSMARDQTTYPRRDDQRLEDNSPRNVSERLMEQLQDWYQSQGVEQGIQVSDGEEHGERKGPSGQESDSDSAEDSNRDGASRAGDFFGEVGRAVEAGEGVVGIDQADYKG